MQRLRILAGLVLLIGCAACAPKGLPPQTVADLGKADTLVRQGCYTCLREALGIYERLTAAKKPEPRALQGAFDSLVLIYLREKELGLPTADELTRAQAMSTALAATQRGKKPAVQPAITNDTILAAIPLVIGETSGFDPEARTQFTGRARPPVLKANPKRRALDPGIGATLTATYVSLAIDCENIDLQPINFQAIVDKYNAVPLIEFRIGICQRGPSNTSRLRESDPKWTDTLFFEARRARTGTRETGPDLGVAIGYLNDAYTAFPESFAIALLRARTNLELAEFEAALAGYDEVLAKAETHRDAMLGRLEAQSYLMRHNDAIATATRMIDLGTWHIGDAYYWRAWNKYNLKDFDPAWVDVEEATKRLANSAVYMLAGLIAYERKQLDTAIDRFDMAFKMDPTACDAVWMSALVNVDQEKWEPAAPKFSRSMTCFVSDGAAAKDELAGVEKSSRTEAQKAKRRTNLQRRIATDEERSAQSAFNAAGAYARTGNKRLAINLVDVAIEYPRLREKAEALKAAILKLP